MKKLVFYSISGLVLCLLLYIGVFKHGFSYFTGIGTPYSYFQAKKSCHDSILTFYKPGLDGSPVPGNMDLSKDSLFRIYGFKWENDPIPEAADFVFDLYNSVIKKELLRRLGQKKWNEYEYKLDSIDKREDETIKALFKTVPIKK